MSLDIPLLDTPFPIELPHLRPVRFSLQASIDTPTRAVSHLQGPEACESFRQVQDQVALQVQLPKTAQVRHVVG